MKSRKVKSLLLFIFVIFISNISLLSAGTNDTLEPTSDNTIDEVESNDDNAQDLSDYFDLATDSVDVLVNGSLADESDNDKYRFDALNNSDLSIQMNITDIYYKDITSMQGAADRTILVTDNNTIWQLTGSQAEKIADDTDIADAVEDIELEDVYINDISVNDLGDIVVALNEYICNIDSDGNITLLYSSSDITTAISADSLQISSIAIYDETVYFTENTGAYILKGDLSSSELEVTVDTLDMSTYLIDMMADYYLKKIVSGQIEDGTAAFGTETIFSTTDTFRPSYMISVSGSETYADGFYITELSTDEDRSIEGNGTIDLVSLDGDDYVLTEFMSASDDIVHPTAIVLSDSDDFDNAMYMGNFDSMGNEFDGHVYKISDDGTAADFVTSYIDADGNTAVKGGEEVTGFYDVIDLKFPTDTDTFGNYLYVLSENIDDDTTSGSSSDIWRIDPNGVAELFVENIMDAAGRMEFDDAGVFDNQLIVAPWGTDYSDTIVTIASDGTISELTTVDTDILDIAVSPEDSFFAGAIVATLSDGRLISIDYDPEDTTAIRTLTWATDLPIGDVPGGNIIFGDENELYLLCGEDKSIVKLDYSTDTLQIIKDIKDIQIQPLTVTDDNELECQAYALVDFGDMPIIIAIDESEDEVSFNLTEDGSDIEETDTIDTVGFCFSPEGHCYLYSDIGGYIEVAEWDQESMTFGSFNELNSISYTDIEDSSTLSYPEIEAITVITDSEDSSASYLYALVSNGINNLPESAVDSTEQDMDDIIINLGNVSEENYSISDVYAASDLNAIVLTITGPDDSTTVNQSITVTPAEIAELDFTDLEGGDYIIQAASSLGFSGDYQLLVTYLGETQELTVDKDNPELSFTLIGDEQVDVTLTGIGQATFQVSVNPENGNVIDIEEVVVSDTNAASTLNIQNSDNPENLHIETMKINSSIKSLSCQGTIDTITTDSTRYHVIYSLNLDSMQEMTLSKFGILTLVANSIGSADSENTTGYSATKTEVNARFIRNMYVNGDVFNINLFDSNYNNAFFKFEVDGHIVGSNIYCLNAKEFLVRNSGGNEYGMYSCELNSLSHIFNFTITEGDLTGSTINTENGSIMSIELGNGSISDSTIFTTGFIRSITIDSDSDDDEGNIINDSTITAYTGLQRIFMAGEFEKDSTIKVYSTISRMICQGDFSGTLNAYRLSSLYIGYDKNGRRLAENDEYTGADFTGDVNVTYQIGTVFITGQMRGDNSGDSTISSSSSIITMISIEDGAEGYVYAGKYIGSIMAGLANGNRSYRVNDSADVRLTVSTSIFGRLYYTGVLDTDDDRTISGNPIIVDLVK